MKTSKEFISQSHTARPTLNSQDPPPKIFQSGFDERAWLTSHGKDQFINFSNEALSQLRKYFNSLDQKQTGSLGVEELQEPFIAFGLSDNRQEVNKLIKCNELEYAAVDKDGSGKIEFDEFLEIMTNIKRGKSSESGNQAMYKFFHRMVSGQLGEDYDQDLSFRMNVSQFRRKKLLDSIMNNDLNKKLQGERILKNFKKQVIKNPQTKQFLIKSKKTNTVEGGLVMKSKKNVSK